jgi:hypothetical protein
MTDRADVDTADVAASGARPAAICPACWAAWVADVQRLTGVYCGHTRSVARLTKSGTWLTFEVTAFEWSVMHARLRAARAGEQHTPPMGVQSLSASASLSGVQLHIPTALCNSGGTQMTATGPKTSRE